MASFCSPVIERRLFTCLPAFSAPPVAALSSWASMGARLPERERERTFIGGVRCRIVVVRRSLWRPNWVITLSSNTHPTTHKTNSYIRNWAEWVCCYYTILAGNGLRG